MDYELVEGLSSEIRERLRLVRPASIVRQYFSLQSTSAHPSLDSTGSCKEDGGNDTSGYSDTAQTRQKYTRQSRVLTNSVLLSLSNILYPAICNHSLVFPRCNVIVTSGLRLLLYTINIRHTVRRP